MKYPDFREWAKGDDLNQSNEFYEAMDLLEEDFSKFEFVMSGLDYWLTNKPVPNPSVRKLIFNWIDCRKTDESKKILWLDK